MDALPHNIEAEQALIGAVLLNNEHYGAVAAQVGPQNLFEPIHAQILQECGRLIMSGRKASPITIKDAFPNVEVVPGVSIAKYLARLAAEGVASAYERDSYIARVRDLSQMREIIVAADDLRRASQNGLAPDSILRDVWDRLDELRGSTRQESNERGPISALIKRLLDETRQTAPVSTSGFSDLDNAIGGGFRSGRLYIVAGRPGMGKTILCLSSARRAARKGAALSIFSLEIDADEIGARMAADTLSRTSLPITYSDIIAHQQDQTRMAKVVEFLSALSIRIDASGGLSMAEIEARARLDGERFAKDGQKLDIVYIDYLGLIKSTDRYRGNKVHELGEIALSAKNMAKRLDCAVVLLAQLNRGVEGRDDKRPIMSDLRDSGNIEEHADFVGLLYRPLYYIEKSPQYIAGDAEAVRKAEAVRFDLDLIIGKNRLGPTKIVGLWCNPALSAVDNKSRY